LSSGSPPEKVNRSANGVAVKYSLIFEFISNKQYLPLPNSQVSGL
jgi:hypothetical protein